MGELGLGWEILLTICDILNIGPPVYSDSAHQKHNQSVNIATRKVLEERLNIGAAGRLDVMKELKMSAGFYTKTGSGRKNDKRVKQANARAQMKFKEARQKIQQAKLAEEARSKARKGVTYDSAAFNVDCFSGSTKRKRMTRKSSGKKGKSKLPRKE
ncbi:Hypothetical predicted protein [Paramuricea clavata]|uniref:Uncharacterized protein n=1 Tax=Paramuricea clavata TaxID=317549 RepID=A0A7D9HXM3_PARCT|nr:Hypothetical predicted protein [Paramuricea clavata]CAB3992408.1 Hypothetical predicted protein [Paramuricea clavata]